MLVAFIVTLQGLVQAIVTTQIPGVVGDRIDMSEGDFQNGEVGLTLDAKLLHPILNQESGQSKESILNGFVPPHGNSARSFVNEEICGTPDINAQARIVGGQDAALGAWPWQAAVYHYDLDTGNFYFQCSATLIRANLVISAADGCLTSADYAPITYISLGTQYTNSAPTLLAVKSIICHRNFTSSNDGHDICAASLVRNVKLSNYIQPACVPLDSQAIKFNETCFTTGWGFNASNANILSNPLQQAEVTVLSTEDCESSYTGISDDQFCAGNSLSYPCFYDEGNPLVCMEDSAYVLKGITSGYEPDCGEDNGKPGRFTDVTKYLDWIEQSSSSFESDDSNRCFDPETILECGGRITQSGTILRSPVGDENLWLYPPNTDCEWVVEAPVGMNINVASLCDFRTSSSVQSPSSCSEDYLELQPSNGRDTKICGTFSAFSYNSSVSLLTIRFRSNSDSNVGRGFVIRIDFVKEGQPDVCYDPQTFIDCGATITKNNTILRSPITSSSNLLYPASTTCEWNVEAPPGCNIHVVSLCEFGTAPLSDTSSCRDDYLQFTLSNGRRYTFCGGLSSFSLNTTGGANKLSIRFRSDADDEIGRGFVAKIIFNGGMGMFRCGALLMTLSVVAYAIMSV